ncbi:unnamed protein product [Ceratitis capitata]|uniref:(Mediterranean fruit fly) hypothetical protein n=1 Tax=Ceratitis capitata TaxID=7213 RepID=A0A811UYN9_CERCA|nr:unnamed protein product [Ceratitis capitata]
MQEANVFYLSQNILTRKSLPWLMSPFIFRYIGSLLQWNQYCMFESAPGLHELIAKLVKKKSMFGPASKVKVQKCKSIKIPVSQGN